MAYFEEATARSLPLVRRILLRMLAGSTRTLTSFFSMRRFGPEGEKNACAGTKRCLFAVYFFVMRWLAVADIAGAAVSNLLVYGLCDD